MSFASLLDKTCTIERGTVADSPTGAQTTAYAPIATAVPCTYKALSGQLTVVDRGKTVPITRLMFFGPAVNVATGDRVRELKVAATGALEDATDPPHVIVAIDRPRQHHVEARMIQRTET